MSQTYKCDRCGSIDDKYMSSIRFTTGSNPLTYKLINYDICDKCTKEMAILLTAWVNNCGKNIEWYMKDIKNEK